MNPSGVDVKARGQVAAKLQDVREAVRVSHALLDSRSRNADRIEALLRRALAEIDALQAGPEKTYKSQVPGLSKAEVLERLDAASKMSANDPEVARDMAIDALLDYINDADIGGEFAHLMRSQLGCAHGLTRPRHEI